MSEQVMSKADEMMQEFGEQRRKEAVLAREYLGWTEIQQEGPYDWTGLPSSQTRRYPPPTFYTNLSCAWGLVNKDAAKYGAQTIAECYPIQQIVSLPPNEAAAVIAEYCYDFVMGNIPA